MAIAGAGLIALVGCSQASTYPPSLEQSVPNQDARQLIAERILAAKADAYRVTAGDLVSIRIPRLPELSRDFRVMEQGRVVLPIVGAVQIAGLSEAEAARRVEGALVEYVNEPDVSLAVREYGGQRVSVLGQVANPGAYPIRGFDQTVADVLTAAGGLTTKAGTVVHFSPATEGGAPASPFAEDDAGIEIDLTRLYDGRDVPALLIPVRGGDTIVVPEAGQVVVQGWVDRPGLYPVSRALTATEVITNAGGMHFGAGGTWVALSRPEGGGITKTYWLNHERILSGEDRDVALKGGDRIEVPGNALKIAGWALYSTTTRIFGIGVGGGFRVDEDGETTRGGNRGGRF